LHFGLLVRVAAPSALDSNAGQPHRYLTFATRQRSRSDAVLESRHWRRSRV